jgi:hypothetical protein
MQHQASNSGGGRPSAANCFTTELGGGAVDFTVGCDLIVDLVGVHRSTASPVALVACSKPD